MTLAAASIMVEFFLAFGFWLPRFRQPALLLGVGFHLAIIALFPAGLALELTVFSLTMFPLYVPFFNVAAVGARVSRHLRRAPIRPEVPAQGQAPHQQARGARTRPLYLRSSSCLN